METIRNASPEAAAILRRMKEVRRDLDEDVQEIVEGARDMGQWRSYVRNYPWVCVGVALAAGYLIVPRRRFDLRRTDPQTLVTLAREGGMPPTLPVPPTRSVRGRLLSFVGDLVLRELSSFVSQQASHFIASQTARSQQEDRS